MVATAPQALRRANLEAVLTLMRSTGVSTGTELIQATGLSRATVIAVCDDLVRLGWVRELHGGRDAAGANKGRPARRFEFHASAACVLGIDFGAAKTTVVVADMLGTSRAKVTAVFRSDGPEHRLETIDAAALQALAEARLAPSSVLAVGVGLAAAVNREGAIAHSQQFWEDFDIGLPQALHRRHGWSVSLENDANVAALAERWRGSGAGVNDLAVLLAGERLGAGLIEGGRLLHGSGGGAGEMAFLDMMTGVGSPEGIGALVRQWGATAAEPGRPPTAIRSLAGNGAVTAELVFRAATEGDAVAVGILGRVAERMARAIGALGTLVNPALVVIGGGVANSADLLVEPIVAALPRFTATPPKVCVSTLGDTIVSVGAVRLALDFVESHALDLALPSSSALPST